MNSWADQVDEEDRSNRLQGDWRNSRYDYAQDQRQNWRQNFNKSTDVDRASSWRSQSDQPPSDHGQGLQPVRHAPPAPGPSQPVKILKRPDVPAQQHPWADSKTHSHSPHVDAPPAGRPGCAGGALLPGGQQGTRLARGAAVGSMQGGHGRAHLGFGDYGPSPVGTLDVQSGPAANNAVTAGYSSHLQGSHPQGAHQQGPHQQGQSGSRPMMVSQPTRPTASSQQDASAPQVMQGMAAVSAVARAINAGAAEHGPCGGAQRGHGAQDLVAPHHHQQQQQQQPQRVGLGHGPAMAARGGPQLPLREEQQYWGGRGPNSAGGPDLAAGWPPAAAGSLHGPGPQGMQVPGASHHLQAQPSPMGYHPGAELSHQGMHPGHPGLAAAHGTPQLPPHMQPAPQPPSHMQPAQPLKSSTQQPHSHATQGGIPSLPERPSPSLQAVRTSVPMVPLDQSCTPRSGPQAGPAAGSHPGTRGGPMPLGAGMGPGPDMAAAMSRMAAGMQEMPPGMMMPQLPGGMLSMPNMPNLSNVPNMPSMPGMPQLPAGIGGMPRLPASMAGMQPPPGQMDRGGDASGQPNMAYQDPNAHPPTLPSDPTPPPPPPPQRPSIPSSTPPPPRPSSSPLPAAPPLPPTAATVSHIENTAIQQADLYQQLESMKKQSMQQSHALQYVMTYMQYLLPQFQALQARNMQLERDNQQLTMQQQQQQQPSQKVAADMQEAAKHMGHPPQGALPDINTAPASPHMTQDAGAPDGDVPLGSAQAPPPGFSKPMAGQASQLAAASGSRDPKLNPREDRGVRRRMDEDGDATGDAWGRGGVPKGYVLPLLRQQRGCHEQDGPDMDDGGSSSARSVPVYGDDDKNGAYRRGGRAAGGGRGARVTEPDGSEVPRPVTPQTPTPRSGRERTGSSRNSPGERKGVNATTVKGRRRGAAADYPNSIATTALGFNSAPSAPGASKPSKNPHDPSSPTDPDAPPPGFSKKSLSTRPTAPLKEREVSKEPLREREVQRERDAQRDKGARRELDAQRERELAHEREPPREREPFSAIDATHLQSKISNLLRPVGSGKLHGGEAADGVSEKGSKAVGERRPVGRAAGEESIGSRGSLTAGPAAVDNGEVLPERPRRERRKNAASTKLDLQALPLGADPSPSPRTGQGRGQYSGGDSNDGGAGSERERRRRMPLQLYTPPKRSTAVDIEGKGDPAAAGSS